MLLSVPAVLPFHPNSDPTSRPLFRRRVVAVLQNVVASPREFGTVSVYAVDG